MPSKKQTKARARSLAILTGIAVFVFVFAIVLLQEVKTLQTDQSLQSSASSGSSSGFSEIGRFKTKTHGKNADNPNAKRTYTFELAQGYNLVSPPVNDPSLSAKSLCRQNSNVLSVTQVLSGSGSYNEYDCATASPKRDFKLSPNVGYFVRTERSTTLTVTGAAADDSAYDVQEGWNAFGFSILVTDPTLNLPVSYLCGQVVDSQYEIVEVDRWQNGGWDAHMCGLEFNNYLVEAGRGYLLRAVNSETGEQMQVKVPGLPK